MVGPWVLWSILTFMIAGLFCDCDQDFNSPFPIPEIMPGDVSYNPDALFDALGIVTKVLKNMQALGLGV
jgi:hypothetical protein